MPGTLYVTVTLYPFYQKTTRSAGAPKRFLVEVPKSGIEKFGKPEAETRIAVELAIETALHTNTAHFGLDDDLRYDIDTRLEQDGKQMRETPYVLNDCRAWVQQAP